MITDIVYKKLVEHMAEAVWMGDEHERTVYANPHFCNMLGYSLDEIIGKPSYVFWCKESAKKVKDINERKRKKGKSSSYEGNLLTKSGKKIPVLANGTPLPDGGTIGIMKDVTMIKEKEANEKMLFNAVQHSTDAIIVCDNTGAITSWNKGAQIIFGYKRGILKKNINILFDPKDMEAILQTTELVNKYELKAYHKNKIKLDVSVTQTPIDKTDNSEKPSYLLICRDITKYRKVEEEIGLKYKKICEAYDVMGTIKRQSDYIFELLDVFEHHYYDKKSVADFIVTSVIMLTRVDACTLRFYHKKSKKLKMISSFGFSEGGSGKNDIKYHNSLLEKAVEANIPLKVINVNREPLHQSIKLARKNNLTSLLLIPLKSKGELIGSISLYTKADKKLEIFENEFIEKYAKVIQIVIAHAFF